MLTGAKRAFYIFLSGLFLLPFSACNKKAVSAGKFGLELPTPDVEQKIFLWSEGKMPVKREYSADDGYYDPPDFRPYMEYTPAANATKKGAIVLCAGGTFAYRDNVYDAYPTAEKFYEYGYDCFVLQYRLNPYEQEESALDLARAVRYVRYYATDYGIDEKDIALIGFSAGGVLCGEFLLHHDGAILPSVLDSGYVPDGLDRVRADVAAVAQIYSFYGSLPFSVASAEKMAAAELPPAFYAYGTLDPLCLSCKQSVNNLEAAGVKVEEHVYKGAPHAFGAGDESTNWTPEYDRFLTDIFFNN